jgi:DNA-binding NarL/FixJ family response regulator
MAGEGRDGRREPEGAADRDARICVICGHRMSRRVLRQVLAREFEAEVELYGSCEDALCSELDHDVFVIYDYFGKRTMNGPQGTRRLRVIRPDAYIVGVTANPGFDKQFMTAGADTALVAGERSTKKIVRVVRERVVTTLYPAEARSLEEDA